MFGFGKRKKVKTVNFEKELFEMAGILEIDPNTATPVQLLAIVTLVFGKSNAESEGTNIGQPSVVPTNYLGLNDYTFADTILVVAFYNLLMVAGQIPVNQFDGFKRDYLNVIIRGIVHLTDLALIDSIMMSDNRIDTYLEVIEEASQNDAIIMDSVKDEFENIIASEFDGEYRYIYPDTPMTLLDMYQSINLKTQVGALFEGLQVSFDAAQKMVVNSL